MGSSWNYPEDASASSYYPLSYSTPSITPEIPLNSPSGNEASSVSPTDPNNNSQYILYNYLTSGSKTPSAAVHRNRYEPYPLSPTTKNQQSSPTSTTTSTTAHFQNGSQTQSHYHSVSVKEIPAWNIYYGDQRQRDRLVEFSIAGNPIKPDEDLNKCVSICFSDVCITKLAVDAIVNSTTENYSGDHGVDKLIHQEAGSSLKDMCRSLPRLQLGKAEITFGFNLSATWIIHTNAPFSNENPDEHLKNCYENALKLLLQYNLKTIAFPCISTGLKKLNREVAAKIALQTVRDFLQKNRNQVHRVIFCLHNPTDIVIYRRFMQIFFPVTSAS